MIRRVLLRVLASTALLAAGAALALAAPAPTSASTDPVVVSSDGVSYADHLPSSLFAGVLIVPGATVTRTFYVKNQTALPGNLAIALRGVTGGDANLIAALSLRATAGTTTGSTVPFTAATPCAPLVGVPLGAGAVVRVDVRLSLSSSLSGLTSQSSVGRFDLPVLLTSTDVPAPNGCTPGSTVPPTNGGGTGGTGGSGGGGVPGPGTIGSVVISGAADGSVPAAGSDDGPLSGLGGKGLVRSAVIIPNTGRFWQEIDISGYLVLLALGGVFAWWRRRRDIPEESYA